MTGSGPLVSLLVAGAIVAPLLLAGLVVARPRSGRWVELAGPAPALLAASLLSAGAVVEVPWLLFGARFGLDDTGRVLLGAAAVVWQVAALYAAGGAGLSGTGARTGFLMAMAGNFGVVLAQDAASFFSCYALMSFSAYLFVVERGDAGARRAGRVYVTLVVLGEVLVLSGLLTAAGAGTAAVQSVPLAGLLLWVGFGIKVGLVPLHPSLPLAYGAAATPGAIALAGAMVNAGLLGWLRFLPFGDPAAAGLGLLVTGFGLAGAFYGVLVGLAQTDGRVLLGYSSVSQMGLVAVGVGAGLVAPQAWPVLLAAVLLFAVHHGLAKAALFAALDLSQGPRPRLGRVALLVPALALIGLPLTSGDLAKAALKAALPALPAPWDQILAVALPLATVGTTLLMARLWFLAAPARAGRSLAAPALLGVSALLLAVLAAPWWLPPLVGPGQVGPGGLGVLWPVLLGAAIAAAVGLLARSGRLRLRARIPPGDLVVPVERLAALVWRAVAPAPEAHHEHAGGSAAPAGPPGRLARVLARGEGAIGRWEAVGLALLALALLVTAAVSLGAG